MMQVVTLILLLFVIGSGRGGGVLAFTTPFSSSSLHTSTYFQRTKLFDGSQSVDNISSSGSASFEDLGLSSELVEVTQRMNWYKPTPVQQIALPAILEELSDENTALWCEGPTGSGKTGGFALPLLQLILESKRTSAGRGSIQGQGKINTLILCPTRELAAQTGSVLQKLVSHLPNSSASRGTRRGNSNISIDVIYGGVPMEAQVSRLAHKRRSGEDIDILVATPGRLVDVLKHKESADPTMSALERRLLDALDNKAWDDDDDDDMHSNTKRNKRRKANKRGADPMASSLSLQDIQEMDLDRIDDDGRASMDEMLGGLNYLVLDEADRLLGGTFQDDMASLLPMFPWVGGDETSTTLKTLLFSATFPEQIEEKVDKVLSRLAVGTPLRVSTTASMMQRVPILSEDGDGEEEMSNRQKKHIAHTTPITNVASDTAPKIQHRVIRLDERDRTQALRFLLEQNEDKQGAWDRVLVFVSTRYLTEHISRKLRRYGIPAAELHGKLDQEARERRLKSFRSGKTRVLLATDLAARGIDIENLPVVVNYDLPRSTADFTHRTGRTGRAGKRGEAISFVTAKEESHFDLIERTELLASVGNKEIKRETLDKFPPNESAWMIESKASTMSAPGASHSTKGLAFDRMHGGIKGRRKSKKDKLREKAAREAAAQQK